jgi:hypothetical protein
MSFIAGLLSGVACRAFRFARAYRLSVEALSSNFGRILDYKIFGT